jgi:hypothetical protein
MPAYIVTEHRGRKIREKLFVGNAADPEEALRVCCGPPIKRPPDILQWRYIDDGMGGGALIDPADEDHCLRADPRDIDDYTEDNYGSYEDSQ